MKLLILLRLCPSQARREDHHHEEVVVVDVALPVELVAEVPLLLVGADVSRVPLSGRCQGIWAAVQSPHGYPTSVCLQRA